MTRNDQSLPPPRSVPTRWADPVVTAGATSVARRWTPLLVWAASLVTAVALLLWLGQGRLDTPAVTAPAEWWHWAATGDPLTVVMGGLRVVALGLAWYLTGVTSISVIARRLRSAQLVRVADALSFGPIRTLAQQAVGVSLAAGVLVTAVPGVDAGHRGDTIAGGDVAVAAPIEVEGVDTRAAAPSGLALREPAAPPVPAPSGAATSAPEVVDVPLTAMTVPPGGPSSDEAVTARMRERRVEPGDHFWSIAATEVADHLGRPGSEDEVIDHWEVLVAANADRLVVRGNPDLLLPGQRLLLPEVAP